MRPLWDSTQAVEVVEVETSLEELSMEETAIMAPMCQYLWESEQG